MERFPRLLKAQNLLIVLDRAITEAERHGDPQVVILMARGAGEAQVELRYAQGELGDRHVDLAEELGLSSGETVGMFRWAESEGYIHPNYGIGGPQAETVLATLEHLESKGYELLGELPNPQERLALILDAAIQAVRRDQSITPEEQRRRIDWFEEAKFVIRTFGVEVAKAVLRGDLPPV